MMTKEADKKRTDDVLFHGDKVPDNHLLRLIEQSIDFDFIYDLVKDKYCMDNGRPSIDPVMLIKIQLIQCLYGIRSTGAGDAFNGGLLAGLSENMDIIPAVKFATALAALSVQKIGTTPSMPAREEIDSFIIAHNN